MNNPITPEQQIALEAMGCTVWANANTASVEYERLNVALNLWYSRGIWRFDISGGGKCRVADMLKICRILGITGD